MAIKKRRRLTLKDRTKDFDFDMKGPIKVQQTRQSPYLSNDDLHGETGRYVDYLREQGGHDLGD